MKAFFRIISFLLIIAAAVTYVVFKVKAKAEVRGKRLMDFLVCIEA